MLTLESSWRRFRREEALPPFTIDLEEEKDSDSNNVFVKARLYTSKSSVITPADQRNGRCLQVQDHVGVSNITPMSMDKKKSSQEPELSANRVISKS